ncbi:MAG: ABC transporter substrate-binding protein [Smithellaceae bacterium]
MKSWQTLLCMLVLMVSAGVTKVWSQDVVIGFSGPLSGPGAAYAQDCANGVDMAVREINAQGGVTVKGKKHGFRLERLDDRTDPTQAVSNANRFVAQYKAPVIFNPNYTAIGALLRINQMPGSPFLLVAYSSIHKFHHQGNKLVINPTSDYLSYIEVQSDLAWQKGWRSGAMVVTLGAYGDAWRTDFKSHWEKKGGTILGDFPVNYYTETNLSSQLTAAIATRPDFLLIGGPSATSALAVEQARGLGFKGGFLLTDQARIDYIARVLRGKNQLNSMIGLAGIADMPLPVARSFSQKYADLYKRPVTWEAAVHYHTMHIIARAMSAAGSVGDPYAIRASIGSVLPTTGDQYPSELFGIDDSGVMYSGSVVQLVENGKFSKVDYVFSFPKTREEFETVKKLSKTSEPENIRWLPLK